MIATGLLCKHSIPFFGAHERRVHQLRDSRDADLPHVLHRHALLLLPQQAGMRRAQERCGTTARQMEYFGQRKDYIYQPHWATRLAKLRMLADPDCCWFPSAPPKNAICTSLSPLQMHDIIAYIIQKGRSRKVQWNSPSFSSSGRVTSPQRHPPHRAGHIP